MSKNIPKRGDVYWINPNPTSGRELKNNHRFVVITQTDVNQLGVATTVPITNGGDFSRSNGLTVPITGHDTTGVALCNQMRAFDIAARIKNGSARYVETLDESLMNDIVDRVVS